MKKSEINLPKTAFSMKANLPVKEPGMIEYWDKINLYQKLREETAAAEKQLSDLLDRANEEFSGRIQIELREGVQ